MSAGRVHLHRRARVSPRRGAVLLEAIISLAIFLAVAAFVLTASRQSLEATRMASLEARGADVARSALAAIDAGLVSTAALDGGDELLEAIGAIDPADELDTFASETGRWQLDVVIDPSEFTGLSLATVTAAWVAAGTDGGGLSEVGAETDATVSIVLRGLVRLNDAEDWDPAEDDLLEGLPGAGGAP